MYVHKKGYVHQGETPSQVLQDDELCVMSLGEKHTCSVLEGAECAHSEKFSMKKLSLLVPILEGKAG